VLPADFRLLRWPDFWMPIGQYADDLTEHIHHAFIGVARLKPGVTLATSSRRDGATESTGNHQLSGFAQVFWSCSLS